MHIFLYGPPGSGKSTIGQLLARNLNLPFVDLDAVIEAKAGMSISQMVEGQGQAVFRELETITLREVVGHAFSVTSQVIALGGGALLREENRALTEIHGTVILLWAELPVLLERLQNDPEKRPLLSGGLQERLASLLQKRKEHYSSFAVQLPVEGTTPEQAASLIQARLGRFHLRAMVEYDVVVQDGGLQQLGNMLRSHSVQNPIVVTDENVAKCHLPAIAASLQDAGYKTDSIVIPPGEDNKNLETVSLLWKSFLEHGLDRKSTVIALGGGVIGDLAGFAASTYMRGIRWIGVPTTLLSMVDASLGGKTGFDLPEGKNMIGSFHPPELVLADPQVLHTLPERELISGMAEVVKHGILSDPQLFDECSRGLEWVRANLEEIVKRAMAVKIKVIEEDPYEKGIRATLNLGHTLGHALELTSRFELRHGEAIAIGMVAEASYAERIGLAEKGLSTTIANVLSRLGLPVSVPRGLPQIEILGAMGVDKKKNASKIRFALPVRIGSVELVDVEHLESLL
jgi:3-dehydroquinate synthase